MKASTAIPQKDRCNYSRPRIAFERALSASFTWHGVRHVVGTCPRSALQSFLIHHACQARLKPAQFNELFNLLSNDDEVARWQCLDFLLELKVKLPLEAD